MMKLLTQLTNTFLLLLLLFSCPLFGQDVPVEIYIAPEASTLRLNGQTYEGVTYLKIELPEREYIVEVSNPKFELFIDTIQVKVARRNVFAFGLIKQSQAYKDYKVVYNEYRDSRMKTILYNTVIPVLNGVALWYVVDGGATSRITEIESDLAIVSRLYANAINPNEGAIHAAQYNVLSEDHESKRKQLYNKRIIGIPLVIGSSYFTYKLLKRVNRAQLEKPLFDPESSLTIHSLNIVPAFNGLALNIKFNF